ncbi:MAG: hypothetical protein RsTaC01_0690 [Candidatus Paraimprobicoccus trichonymphae]|uniref:Uncharacterized protein n=1 Tax=Candidatus Paraimprobicoccus trichonymphae TaxID=3033793 RepID=A0AA48L1H6_9FIRM|nr:MAG: hypothetical protein RsTaC01_0690 [Candidatus Paraimprobicoccus trichonymphae]
MGDYKSISEKFWKSYNEFIKSKENPEKSNRENIKDLNESRKKLSEVCRTIATNISNFLGVFIKQMPYNMKIKSELNYLSSEAICFAGLLKIKDEKAFIKFMKSNLKKDKSIEKEEIDKIINLFAELKLLSERDFYNFYKYFVNFIFFKCTDSILGKLSESSLEKRIKERFK